MSGAEIFAIVASATQLADIGWRVYLKLSRLSSDVHHAPQSIRLAASRINQLVDLARAIKIDSAFYVIPLGEGPHPIRKVLEECDLIISDLEITLSGIKFNPDESKHRKLWRSLISATKEKDVLDRCEQLENCKTTITGWMSHELLARNHEEKKVIESILQTMHRIELEITRNKSEDHVLARLLEVSRVPSESSAQLQISHSGSTNSDSVAQLSNTTNDQTLLCLPQTGLQASDSQVLTRNQTEVKVPTRCTCSKSHQDYKFTEFFSLRLNYVRNPLYLVKCPIHKKGGQFWQLSPSFTMSVLKRLVTVSFNIYAEAERVGFNICKPTSLRIVDHSKSPAFQLFAVNGRWRDWHYSPSSVAEDQDLAKLLLEITDDLRLQFACGRASPLDIDEDGRTLLHCTVERCMELTQQSHGVPEFGYHCKQALRTLICCLIDSGVPVNAEVSNGFWLWGRTALSLVFEETQKSGDPLFDIDLMLAEAGCDVSSSNPLICMWAPFNHMSNFSNRHPAVVDDFWSSPVKNALFRKSEPSLRKALKLEWIDRSSCLNEYDSAMWATQWPSGLKIIIESQKNLFSSRYLSYIALEQAILGENKASVRLLLNAGSYIDAYMICDFCQNHTPIQQCLVEALKARRRALHKRCKETFSEDEWSTFGTQEDLPDASAPFLASLLLEKGQKPPSFCGESWGLELGRHPVSIPSSTVYHAAIRSKFRMDLADCLFENGFTSVDTPNRRGETPLMRACSGWNIEMIRWLIRKGAKMPFRNQFSRRDPLHYFAETFLGETPPFHEQGYQIYIQNRKAALELPRAEIGQRSLKNQACSLKDLILSDRSFIRSHCKNSPVFGTDFCVCYCAPVGCNSIHVLLKSRQWELRIFGDRNALYNAVRRWIYFFGHGPEDLEKAVLQLARFDLFERLGMAHTCCEGFERTMEPSCTEIKELRSEDEGLAKELEIWMDRFKAARAVSRHDGWKFWSQWVKKLDRELPHDTSTFPMYRPYWGSQNEEWMESEEHSWKRPWLHRLEGFEQEHPT
ncbi:MAG: hypothetical protein M1814_006772 [Vezdaea aestivalis]|nr:MAG: hypothetical protein M1814_006772 [Vezdaea aestivalis]